MIRTELFKHLGGFDDDFFMYFEDCDLSCRVIEAGWQIVFYPDVQVIHHWQRASAKQIGAFLMQVKSMFKFFKKHGW
jgi:GT2 family glycosyltransferase